jgi:hypothetical protein
MFLLSRNEIIGTIGVSGSSVENDHTVAEAGAGAISLVSALAPTYRGGLDVGPFSQRFAEPVSGGPYPRPESLDEITGCAMILFRK